MKLRMSRPAVTRIMSASATSDTTSTDTSLRRSGPPVVLTAPSVRPCRSAEREIRIAGQRPTRIAVRRRGRQRKDRRGADRARAPRVGAPWPLPVRDEGVNRRPRHRESRDARQHREDETFDKRLSNEPPSIRANRGADGEFTLAIRCSSQQQARDVGASEQQHEHDGTEEHSQRVANGPGKVVAERERRSRSLHPASVRVFASELLRDDRELGLRTVEVDAGCETCHNTPVAGAPVRELWILQRSGTQSSSCRSRPRTVG